jgi:predicted small metal-binding protein
VELVLRCDCGFEARAEQEDELVATVQRHASEAHGMALSMDEALLLAFQAELGEKAWSRANTQGADGSAADGISDREGET